VTHRDDLLHEDADHASIHAISRQYLLGPVYYLRCVGRRNLQPAASVLIDLLLAIFFALPARNVSSSSRRIPDARSEYRSVYGRRLARAADDRRDLRGD